MKNENQDENVILKILLELEKTNEKNLASGACIFTPPSGRPQCFQMTPEQCTAIKGVYIGGKCPNTSIEEIEETQEADSPIIEIKDIKEENLHKDCTCTLNGKSYPKGTTVCILGKQHSCGCDGWVNLGHNC